ncbi:tRNA-splicing endonuclease subunit Sen2, partial [Conglomerata obtusa]
MDIEVELKSLKIYFQDQGFVVKDGLKYGVDFLLYTDVVEKVHSKYAVMLNRNFTYLQIVSMQRLCTNVKKKLIVVNVNNGVYELFAID